MKIETHLHSSQTSRCGRLPGERMAELYAESGYGAAILTDHINKNTGSADAFLAGYRAFAERAGQLGLIPLLGAEARLVDLGPEDYLIYGLSEGDVDWLLALLCREPSLVRFSEEVRGRGWLLIQAHPYRDGLMEAADYRCLDGVEVLNGNPRHEAHDDLARAFADAHGLIATAGSDAHRPEDVCRTGLIVPDGLRTMADFTAYLRLEPRPHILAPGG